ncbi:MAG: UDP-N-acetylmuramoyl-tripeptide--D-alanyl-D-alanine ligase [Erysipelotrichaceae bacterium]|nr:UDP-N-acetylmuramoyl-tripeptide--D-alanyl-D-alanine ligase [Erysipelotrichaceae bacterium]
MNNIETVSRGMLLLLMISHLSLSFVYVKNALHMFQQNRYELKRYTAWLFNRRNIRFVSCLIYFAVIIIVRLIFRHAGDALNVFITIIFAIWLIMNESKREYIKPLVLTSRVKRQIAVITLLLVLFTYAAVRYLPGIVSSILAVYLPYLLIYPMAIITEPIEEAVKKRYENEARDIIDSYDDLIKIGITGSYGKTTTKNVVKDIIGEKYYTLITPASYNTPMGITRTIREQFKPIYEVFVCEMGADHVGEISYLMDFVKPKYGIVTSIGPQHLNTFGSLENIISEKMQEIEKLPSDGVGIINIDNEYIRDYKIKNSCRIVTVGINNTDADYVAYDLKYSNKGSSFKVKLGARGTTFNTILLGEHNIMNILCGIALAKELGMTNREIVRGVSSIRQVEHRLQIKNINGFTFIDNAFNSNPVGCKRSLDVLSLMNGKRVIVTPGLIDLGPEEDKDNYEFGAYMKDRADFVILVGEKNSAFIHKGLEESGYDMDRVLVVNNVKEAFAYIYQNFKKTDTILLENDLPDAFLY